MIPIFHKFLSGLSAKPYCARCLATLFGSDEYIILVYLGELADAVDTVTTACGNCGLTGRTYLYKKPGD